MPAGIKDEKGKALLTKPLEQVWEAFPAYGPRNTLLVDDSALKTTMNPARAVFTPPPFQDPDKHDDALLPGGLFEAELSARRKSIASSEREV